jgi:HSP20 family molecular chaperone IbpA
MAVRNGGVQHHLLTEAGRVALNAPARLSFQKRFSYLNQSFSDISLGVRSDERDPSLTRNLDKRIHMKTYHYKNHIRIWSSRLVAVGLGLSGLTCLAATPATPQDKATPGDATATAPEGGASGTATNNSQDWEDQMANRMQHIQQEMNDLFRDSMKSMDSVDNGFFSGPKFDASATVQDRGNNYVATFYLPNRDLGHVKVNIKDGVLAVNASAEETTKSKPSTTGTNATNAPETELLSEYEQLVTLPGPVDAGKMKVEKTGDNIVVTIPKKDEKTASAQ